ncbi:MAG: MobA/MobL family protein [Clostridia bacterium]|nr:MobA/MobL family protein [Clostridia bacterium]
MRGTTMLADIGNGTMNILYLIDGRPSESRSWTEKQGVNQCVIATRNVVMDKFGVKIDDSIIEQILRTGTAAIGKPYLECTTAVALHDPDLPGHNPHAHILLTMRSLDEHGDWQYKTEKEYLCVCGDEEQGFTADEFDHAKLDGWDKQSLYKVGRKKVYMAPSAAEVIRYCVR